MAVSSSPTGSHLADPGGQPFGGRGREAGRCGWLVLRDATGHNLKKVTLELPLATLVTVTGVSGSGKTSLIHQTLYPVLASRLHKTETRPLPHAECSGFEQIDRVIAVDQKPIGRSTRSNTATYT